MALALTWIVPEFVIAHDAVVYSGRDGNSKTIAATVQVNTDGGGICQSRPGPHVADIDTRRVVAETASRDFDGDVAVIFQRAVYIAVNRDAPGALRRGGASSDGISQLPVPGPDGKRQPSAPEALFQLRGEIAAIRG